MPPTTQALNLYEVSDGQGEPMVYAHHNEAGAVKAYVDDAGGTDAAADARVTARIIPWARVLRYTDPNTGKVEQRPAGELAERAKPGQLVLAAGCLCA